jgi:hypothetical protein
MNTKDILKASHLKMISRRDGIKAGSLLSISEQNRKAVAIYNRFEFSQRWIELAIKQKKAKLVYRCYALV